MFPSRILRVCAAAGVLFALNAVSGAIVQFDIDDSVGPSPTEPGWVGVTGSSDNADTLTGTDGVHTLVLSTSGDGQDRDRNASLFAANAGLWRDFWFVANSTVGGAQATATLSGFAAGTKYTVEIWGYDKNSTGNRAMTWTDAVTGNGVTSSFNGDITAVPASLSDCVATLTAQSDASGVITLAGAAATGGSGGLPNVFVSGLRVSAYGGQRLPTLEAEAGTLGAEYAPATVAGVAGITPSTTGTGANPGSAARVASYAVQFPSATIYQLYARVYVGAGSFNDDSFFYGSGFGVKSPTTNSDWVAVLSGLADTGYTAASEQVVVGGGSAGIQVWKWVKFGTFFTVSEGALARTFQIGAREDGFYLDKLVFAPADVPLTVAELESGVLPERPPTEVYEGPDGVAVHRFDEPYKATNDEGAQPASGLVLQDGLLWGLSQGGGLQGAGTVFKLSPDGTAFDVANTLPAEIGPGRPQGALTAAAGGVFYGTSQTGGSAGTGTVFKRQADGSLLVLRNFAALAGHTGFNTGGAAPSGPLLLSGSTLYGATSLGGANGQGVLFSLGVDGSGFTVLREFGALSPVTGFNADGARPCGGLVLSGGRLFGVAAAGGAGGAGVVFSLDPTGAGYSVLHSFLPLDATAATNLGGAFPCNGLVLSGGRLCGATLSGGVGGQGTLFSLGTEGNAFAVLHDFSAPDPATGVNADGVAAVARLTVSGNLLYGAASGGGAGATGTVFSLDVTAPVLRTLYHFETLATDGTNAHGAHPVAELLRVNNTLCGTAFSGGPGSTGVVFAITLPLSSSLRAEANPLGGNDLTVDGLGAPFSNYTIQATSNLAVPTAWQNVLTTSADASGRLSYTESNQTAPLRFFRVISNP